MARTRKKAAPTPPATADQDAPVAVGSPDVFDRAISARHEIPADPTATPESHATGFAARLTRPDPFGELTVSLSDAADGPKARLYRSQRFQQMAIQFDEKPADGIRQRLRDAGWTWRGAEGVWTKQLGDRPGESQRQAQEVFEGVTNDIRQANGLEPLASPAPSR